MFLLVSVIVLARLLLPATSGKYTNLSKSTICAIPACGSPSVARRIRMERAFSEQLLHKALIFFMVVTELS